MHKRTLLGRTGEDLVAQALTKRGFTIMARNYTLSFGEIDIIACKDDLILFIEVKMRTSCLFDPSDVIVYSKQKKIIAVAKYWLAQHTREKPDFDPTCRFDVALIEGSEKAPSMTYIADAFSESI